MSARQIVVALGLMSAGFAPVEPPLPGNLVEVPVAAPGEVFIPPAVVSIPEDKQGDMVKLGRRIFTDTVNHARRYTGNALACSSCHLSEGRKPDAAPMWAAWVRYPRLGSNGAVKTFESQVQDCFHFEMQGQSPPLDSPEMQALVAYAQWLASGAPTRAALPGQGFGARAPLAGAPEAAAATMPSARRGAALYRDQCLLCHGANGAGLAKPGGGYQFPPLWGKHAFTGGSGFARPATLAAYVQANMPLARGGSLSDRDAADIAAYLLAQPRVRDPRTGWINRGIAK